MKALQQFVAERNSQPFQEALFRVISMTIFGLFFTYYFSESMGNMLRAWQLPQGYSHGPLVASIWLSGVVFLCWQSDSNSSSLPSMRSTLIAVPAIVFTCILNKVGEKFAVETIQYFTITAFVLSAIWFLYRPEKSFKFFLLSLILVSGIPIWDISITILQPFAIKIVETVLTMFRVPVLFSDSFVTLPYGTFQIADGCSGLRYVLSALAFSAIYAFLYIENIANSMFFIVATCALVLVFNTIRIILIVWVGYVSEMQSALVQNHYIFGWFIFCVALILSLWLGQKLRYGESRDEVASG